jgi:hypothetical protein
MKNVLFSESYKLSLGQWSFFALVLDGTAQRGLLQVDYAYGYNNETTDFKVLPCVSKIAFIVKNIDTIFFACLVCWLNFSHVEI